MTVNRKPRAGFTLIELIVAVIIMLVLAGLGTIAYTQFVRGAHANAAASSASILRDAIVAKAAASDQSTADVVSTAWTDSGGDQSKFLTALGTNAAGTVTYEAPKGTTDGYVSVVGDNPDVSAEISLPPAKGEAPTIAVITPDTAPTLQAGQTITDGFDGSGDLNGSTVGTSKFKWVSLNGTWTRSASKATTTMAANQNPVVITDLRTADADLKAAAYTGFAGGDSLYFRVKDGDNWWRLRQFTSQSSYTYPSSCTITGGWYMTTSYTENMYSPPGTYYGGSCGGGYTSMTSITQVGTNRVYVEQWSRPYSYTSGGTGYTNNYYLYLDKNVNGTVTTAKSYTVSSFGDLHVSTAGDNITVYRPGSTTALGTVTDAANNDGTQAGVGLGVGGYQTTTNLGQFTATVTG